jgi:hypothetical protein
MNPVISWLKYRIKNGKGNNIVICGEPGIGKSRRGIRLGELLDSNGFKKEKIAMSAEAFTNYINTSVKAGDAIVWDENIGAEAGDWYTQSNKAIKRTMQVMRKKGFTFIQCLPSIKDLDPKIRHLFHVYVEPMKYDIENDGYWCKVMRIQHNPLIPRTYYKYFRFKNGKTGTVYICKQMLIKNPENKELVEWYEKYSDEEKNKIHAETEQTLIKEKEKSAIDWRKPLEIDDYVEQVINNLDKCITKWQGKKILNIEAIQNLCGVGQTTAKRIRAKIKVKGVKL